MKTVPDLACFPAGIILALAVMISLAVPASGPAAEAGKMITIVDAYKNKIEIFAPVKRIVVINSDAAEILCAIKAGDKIVGVSNYIAGNSSKLLPELKEKPVVGPPTHPSIEKIVELWPDLVLYYDMWLKPEALEAKLAPLGIPVARIPCYRIRSMAKDVRILGRITGREKEAQAYIAFFQQYLDEVAARLKGLKQKRRMYAEGYGEYSTISKGSGANGMLEIAGADNIASGQPVPFPEISPEWVVEKNPEVIIKAASAGWVKTGYEASDVQALADFRNALMNRPAWYQVEAVKKQDVYILSSEIWAGPRAPIGILYIAKWCYPELLKDIDPENIHSKWLMKWHKKELKGIYGYPGQKEK